MKGYLIDHNAYIEVECLKHSLTSSEWSDMWSRIPNWIAKLEDVGLKPDSPDVEVWKVCQRQQLVLLTNNRNNDGPDSLEEAIRTLNGPDCLPVFTFANSQRLRTDSDYAAIVVENFLEYSVDIDNYRGVGRLFLPKFAE